MEQEILFDTHHSKQEKQAAIVPQVKALVQGETNLIANLANISAVLKTVFDYYWVGFYIKEQEGLVLGPFQGPVACTRIGKGKGVCGKCVELKQAIIVPNVNEFEGHIACSSATQSEIVVPVIKNNQVRMIIDVDSLTLADFDQEDQVFLEKIAEIIADSL